jgi:hypothetical protein
MLSFYVGSGANAVDAATGGLVLGESAVRRDHPGESCSAGMKSGIPYIVHNPRRFNFRVADDWGTDTKSGDDQSSH